MCKCSLAIYLSAWIWAEPHKQCPECRIREAFKNCPLKTKEQRFWDPPSGGKVVSKMSNKERSMLKYQTNTLRVVLIFLLFLMWFGSSIMNCKWHGKIIEEVKAFWCYILISIAFETYKFDLTELTMNRYDMWFCFYTSNVWQAGLFSIEYWSIRYLFPILYLVFVFTPDTFEFLSILFYSRYIFKVSNTFEYLNTFTESQKSCGCFSS